MKFRTNHLAKEREDEPNGCNPKICSCYRIFVPRWTLLGPPIEARPPDPSTAVFPWMASQLFIMAIRVASVMRCKKIQNQLEGRLFLTSFISGLMLTPLWTFVDLGSHYLAVSFFDSSCFILSRIEQLGGKASGKGFHFPSRTERNALDFLYLPSFFIVPLAFVCS